ncbi:translation initiation factor aIF-2/yIF-2 [Caldisphaera lagunensis DSM 15908]|uniref:Probable translation initiation factor IF-2 n=1 Tax=Caldisphaera lagunensis (strain DSM 15908 / JCM 11604 / ANMR 0165 / IC-154) TaxID=1056495 RepID=L0AB05_CALLD|nr:translation initiation factor IF-2 [Caldisphaera lagunensis]AFZ70220.1 translation initiation factor aIF-2/yIF-2 [Caldisphaera lagunensis DSM 15908]
MSQVQPQGQTKKLRQPIVVVLGHVDHGKTSLLDKIRSTAIAAREAGGITQHIGASIVPSAVIEKISEPLKKIVPIKLAIPGLLFIDTPGHELFSNLRKRGGSIADFAILVIDVTKGLQDQTFEAIDLLKSRKVPFLIAANKIDRLPGWESNPDQPFVVSYQNQSRRAKEELERVIYGIIVTKFSELGFQTELYTKIKDFTKTVAIVPVSAKTGEGIPDLLAVLAGLTQQYLKNRLIFAEGPAKGSVLEVKEAEGLGTVIDTIIYDGIIRVGDIIVLNGKNGPIITNVRSLLMPAPLSDLRAKGTRFVNVSEVYAAAGVRIAAPDLENALAGSSIYVANSVEEANELSKTLQSEVKELIFKADKDGIIIKADTLGTLEALIEAFKRMNIPIRVADIGNISKSDVLEASLTAKKNRSLGVIIAFNVKILPEAEAELANSNVKVIQNNIIYHLIEEYENWSENLKREELQKELDSLIRPGKFKILPGYVFRRSDPAIVGVEVNGGIIKPGYPLINEKGKELGRIMAIKDKDKSLEFAKVGQAVAISIEGKILIGRHANEGDEIYTDVPLEHAMKLVSQFKNVISNDELLTLKEIAEIKKNSGFKEYNLLLSKIKDILDKKINS